MKKIIVSSIIAMVVIIIGYRIATHTRGEKVQSIIQIQKEKGVPVEVAEVVSGNLEQRMNFTGTVEGINQAEALAQVMEKIVELKVNIGDRVKTGDIIAVLDPNNPQVRLSQADLALLDAERELKRMESLYQQGAISQQILEKTQLGYEIAKSNLEHAQDLLNVKAPIDGQVTDIFFSPGETPPPGETIARIAQTDRIKVKVEISSIHRNEIKLGQKGYIFTVSNPDYKITGRVDRVARSANPDNRNFEVYITADNQNGYFQPGMSAEVEIVVMNKNNVLTIPQDALVKEGGRNFVFVAEERARKVEVVPGFISGREIEIKSGLSRGQKIVVNGQNNLKEGDLISIVGEGN
jgi:RND family efflux transporter MFP subunit